MCARAGQRWRRQSGPRQRESERARLATCLSVPSITVGCLSSLIAPQTVKMQLSPASGTTLAPNGADAVLQTIKLNNTQHGARPLELRLLVTFKLPGGAGDVREVVPVTNLPPGL